jgi:Family of unknown function (DUF6489)
VKISFDVDCTPDEARTFCGLPNVKPMQEAVTAHIEKRMLEAVAAMSPDALLKLWLPLVPQNTEQFRGPVRAFLQGAVRLTAERQELGDGQVGCETGGAAPPLSERA